MSVGIIRFGDRILLATADKLNSHELLYRLAQQAADLGVLVVIATAAAPEKLSPSLFSGSNMIADTSILMDQIKLMKLEPPEPPEDDYINGDLSYLYRFPIKPKRGSWRRLYTIRQPCWRAGRWKSLT